MLITVADYLKIYCLRIFFRHYSNNKNLGEIKIATWTFTDAVDNRDKSQKEFTIMLCAPEMETF